MTAPVLLWFRRDLRRADNPALVAAVESGAPIVPVFVWSPEDDGAWPPGAASRAYLARSLAALEADLRSRQSRLIVRQGRSEDALPRLAAELRATAVYANRRHEPAAAALSAAGVVLGKTYPKPMVDHATARERALAALASTRGQRG